MESARQPITFLSTCHLSPLINSSADQYVAFTRFSSAISRFQHCTTENYAAITERCQDSPRHQHFLHKRPLSCQGLWPGQLPGFIFRTLEVASRTPQTLALLWHPYFSSGSPGNKLTPSSVKDLSNVKETWMETQRSFPNFSWFLSPRLRSR